MRNKGSLKKTSSNYVLKLFARFSGFFAVRKIGLWRLEFEIRGMSGVQKENALLDPNPSPVAMAAAPAWAQIQLNLNVENSTAIAGAMFDCRDLFMRCSTKFDEVPI